MPGIEKVQDVDQLRERWSSLFISNDPFVYPFVSRIEASSLFYPTEGYRLSREQYLAVTNAARAVGDKGFILSEVEWDEDFFERGKHWFCRFPSYEEYLSVPLGLENAIYSPNFTWGVLISHEDHAVLGGSKTFMDTIYAQYPRKQTDIEQLHHYWRDNPNNGWVAPLLASLK